jgi:peroxiredoxin
MGRGDAKPLELELDVVLDDAGVMGALGNPRCKRFACFIDDGVIKSFFVSEAPDE